MGKVLLVTQLDTLREHLLLYQLVVGVPAGAEVMLHVAATGLPGRLKSGTAHI